MTDEFTLTILYLIVSVVDFLFMFYKYMSNEFIFV